MLRRVVSHPLFYVVLLGALVVLVLSARSVKWQWRLGVRTSQKQIAPAIYQQKSHVDNSVIGVTMLHLELSQPGSASTISFAQAVEVLKKSDALLANNVIAYLQNATNKKLALETYTRNIDKTLSEADQAKGSLQLDRDVASQDYQQCASAKSSADNQFFQGLRTIDGAMLQEGYNDALSNGSCEATARISTNAYQAVITRMDTYTSALTQVNDLLTENEDDIVTHIDLFKDSYLERLIQIRDELAVVTTNSSTID